MSVMRVQQLARLLHWELSSAEVTHKSSWVAAAQVSKASEAECITYEYCVTHDLYTLGA